MKNKLFILFGLALFFEFSYSNACTSYYIKKNNQVSYRGYKSNNKIEKADYGTFEIISTTLAKDRNNLYYLGKIVNEVNPESFKIIKEIENTVGDCMYSRYIIEDSGKKFDLK